MDQQQCQQAQPSVDSALSVPLSESPKIPHIPSSLYGPILAQLTVGDPRSIDTLLNASLVSRAFAAAASSSAIWQPHLDRGWLSSNPPAWVQLPSTCSHKDQQYLDKLFGRSDDARAEAVYGRGGFKLRVLLDKFGGDHLERLVWSEGSKLRSIDVLCALGKQLEDGVFKRAERWVGDGHLCTEYWLDEIKSSMERRKAARYWRSIDSGDLCDSDQSRREWGAASFAAFAGGDIGQCYGVYDWATHLVAPAVFQRCPYRWKDLQSISLEDSDLLVKAKLILSAESLFKIALAELMEHGVVSPASKDSKKLDSSFLNFVRGDATRRIRIFRQAVGREAQLTERGAWPDEIRQSIVNPLNEAFELTTSMNSFGLLLNSVCARLPRPYTLNIYPTLEPHLYCSVLTHHWKRGEARSDVRAEAFFNIEHGEVFLKPEKSKEKRFQSITPYESIRRIASDICASLAIHSFSSRVSTKSARYAQLLVPSVISQPYEGPEAVIRLSAAAVKLATHVEREFPFDVSLLEQQVLPLVWGTHARKVIEDVIKRVKEESETVIVKRRSAEGPHPFQVGSFCFVIPLECLGVVVGWDESYDQTTAGRIIGEKETLDHGKDQPFYTVLLDEPYGTLDSPSSYYAEDELSFDVEITESEAEELSQVHEMGRWFHGVGIRREQDGEVSGCQMLPSAELQGMYLDD